MAAAIRILYVDDEPGLLDIGKLFLERAENFEVTTAISAPEAIRLLEQQRFDAIISDYQMPEMDGIQFLVEVRTRFGQVPFILFTGRGREEVVIQAINSGADFYIQKGGEPKSQFAELSHKIKSATSLKKANEAQYESEEKYRTVFENTGTATVVLEENSIISLANNEFAQLSGFSKGDIEGKKSWTEFVVKEDLEQMLAQNQIRREGSKGALTHYEFRFVTKSGDIRAIYLTIGVITGTKKSIASLLDITERKRAEEALLESEQKYRDIFENSVTGLFKTSPNGQMINANDALARMYGYFSAAEILKAGVNVGQLYADIEDRKEVLHILAEKGIVENYETPHLKQDGTRFWVSITARTIRNADGVVLFYEGTNIDITENRRAVEWHRAEHELVIALASTASLKTGLPLCLETAVQLSGMDSGGIYLVSETTGDLDLAVSSGLSDEFVKETSSIRADSDSARLVLAGRPIYSQHLQLGVPLTGARATEKLRAIAVIPILSKNRVIACFNIASHIRDTVPDESRTILESIAAQIGNGIARFMAEEATRTSEEQLHNFLNNLPVGLYRNTPGPTGKYLMANPYIARMHGYDTPEEFLCKPTADMYANPDERIAFSEYLIHQGSIFGKEIRLKRKNKEIFWGRVSAVAVRNQQGEVKYFDGFIEDITERKQVEERIRWLASFPELNPNPVIEMDAQGSITFANTATLKTLRDLGLPENPQAFVPEDKDEILRQLRQGSESQLYREITLNNETFAENIALIQEFQVVRFFTRNITDRKRAENELLKKNEELNASYEQIAAAQEELRANLEELTRQELALRENEERYRTVFENTGTATVVLEESGIISLANEEFAQLCGFSKDAIEGQKGWTEFVVKEDLERMHVQHRLRRQDEAKALTHYEFRFVTKSGDIRNIYLSIGVIPGTKKSVASLLDITGRKRAEELYQTIFENMGTAMIILEEDTTISRVNDEMENIWGYSKEEIEGRVKWPTLVAAEDLKKMLEYHHLRRSDPDSAPRNYEFRLIHKNGTLRNAALTAAMIPGTKKSVISLRDITDFKKAGQALHESGERLNFALESAHLGLWDLNFVTYEVIHNRQWTEMLGFSSAEMDKPSSWWQERVHPDDSAFVSKRNEDHVAGRAPYFDCIYRMRHENGNWRWVHSQGKVVSRDIDGRPLRMIGINQDITGRKVAEEALQQANKKLTLLSSLTRHDINNQLTVLLAYLDILEQKQPDPTLTEYFQKLATAAQRISSMIQFTKEYEKIGVKAPVWQDCRTLVDTAAKDTPLGQVIVKNDLPVGTEVFADPLVVKVCYNLMDNAVRYGGKITTIRFSVEERDGDHIVVCEDDGDGVPQNEKEMIFDRGFGKNTGLGLALSQEILAITGITIRETGEPGKGARFEMAVPKGAYRLTDVK